MKFEYDLPDLMQLQRYGANNPVGQKILKKIRGVYGLFNGGQLLYVGMSLDLWRRLQQHKVEPFTHYILQEFKNSTRTKILVYEAIYIHYYQPPWNNKATKKEKNM